MVSKQALGLVFTILQLNRVRRMGSFNYLLIPTAPHQAANKHAQTIPQLALSHKLLLGGNLPNKNIRMMFPALLIKRQ